MTTKELKQLFKEAAREVFQEELKEILLEAVRSPKQIVAEQHKLPNLNSSGTVPYPSQPITSNLTPEFKKKLRASYAEILNETASTSFGQKGTFNPIGVDPINGELPEGDLDMSYIMNLMGKK